MVRTIKRTTAKVCCTGVVLVLLSIPLMIHRNKESKIGQQQNELHPPEPDPPFIADDHRQGPTAAPTVPPEDQQTTISSENESKQMLTFVPGNLTVIENGLRLSTGLKSRIIATSGVRVTYENGTTSPTRFHKKPDGAAVLEDPSGEGWVYVSNAESASNGGVGAIRFDRKGSIVGYEMILTGTKRNCQGGLTPWKSWVSCEEDEDDGQCWETDPFGKREARMTYLGGDGGNFEAFASDYRDPMNPYFFITNDKSNGEFRRFTPNPDVVNAAMSGGDHWDILSEPGTLEYLVLHPYDSSDSHDCDSHPYDSSDSDSHDCDSGAENAGTFTWTTDLKKGKRSAKKHFRNCEGLNVVDGTVYFVSSRQKDLFALDLDRGTYKKTSTVTSDFVGKPDGLFRNNGILYITEETKSRTKAGVYGLDLQGNVFTMFEAKDMRGDATGIALSPSKKHLYVSYQRTGKIVEITRTDGMSFDYSFLEIVYNAKDID